jgi:hypothetical protein
VERHAGQGVIDVTDHFRVGNFLERGLNDVSVVVLERHFAAFHDVLRKEFPVGVAEELFRQGHHLLVVIFAVGIGGRQLEVELVAGIQAGNVFLEGGQQLADAVDEGEWALGRGLLDVFGRFALFEACERVLDGNKLAKFDLPK